MQQYYPEQTINLPGGMVCFAPIADSPLPGALPVLKNGFITFGSFNNSSKISDKVLSMWADVLHRNSKSRFVLKLFHGSDDLIRNTYIERFAKKGIDSDRIDVVGYLPYYKHLEVLSQVDMVLDTFPYNGCVSTMESLWMGVPVVTLCGETLVSRVGATILKRIGMDMFVAHNEQEYVDKACAFALQVEHLGMIRGALRKLVLNSPLCDCSRYAVEMQQAFRNMWQQWCASVNH